MNKMKKHISEKIPPTGFVPLNQLIQIASRWEAMCDILEGNEVSDFMLSFPEVRELADLMSDILEGNNEHNNSKS